MDAEHDEIAKSKQEGEALTREDVTRMKLSWRVAQESTRGHRGRRLRHPERVAGVLVAMRDAHGPGQVLAVPVRRPGGVGGATAAAALIVRGVRRRAEGGSCAAACGEENTFVRDPLPTPLNGLPVELDRIAPLW
uniref:Uncharacterized protein n=1 Tax=Oryza sativa subsp. japonica TaxID=39947 RepID=Q8H517_ORYSJ|nr:hypothetical protein [Oryza sativa Japonica Group]